MYIRTCSTGGRDANYSGHGHGSGHELFFPSGSRFFFSQFLFSHSPRSLDALSVASTALKTGPRPRRRAQKTSIEFVSSGLPFAQPACPPCTSLKTASSLRMPGGFCCKAAADNSTVVGPRLDSVQVQLGVSSMYSVQLRQRHKSCRASASPT